MLTASIAERGESAATGAGAGAVTEVHTDDVTKTIKGRRITRKASEARPAVAVKTDKGGKVLKSTSEIKPS